MGDVATQDLVNLASLARHIAQDILEIDQILQLHKLDDATWEKIRTDTNFQQMLDEMILRWNGADSTKERIKVKAQTAIEALIEPLFLAAQDPDTPLSQRTEAIRQLARLGELEGRQEIGQSAGSGVQIQINVGNIATPVTIEAVPNLAPPEITE